MFPDKRNKAIFLDRDGVINIERGTYTYTQDDFVFVEGIFETLNAWKQRGFLFIVITNQSGISKGIYSEQQFLKLTSLMLSKFSEKGIEIMEVYYCPHHPVHSNCICRKPDSLLIEKAMARFNIDPALSYFIGDKERDIIAAEKVGIKAILLPSNTPLNQALIE